MQSLVASPANYKNAGKWAVALVSGAVAWGFAAGSYEIQPAVTGGSHHAVALGDGNGWG
ncbi:hypothetical protein [Planotetraspora sp. GP83]|uniref:hypothetical protein n=1 Tax=Planotetraspora sp. GP83 TaxID=3156264 RepID=UPI003517CEBF